MPEYTPGAQEILPEGDYDFTVDDAGEKESQKGNPMIELQLLIENNGSQIRVFDQLTFTPSAFWKIDSFRIATGEKLVEGEKVNFTAEECLRRRGRLRLFVDEYLGKKKNKVESYLPPSGTKPAGKKSVEPDDLPF